MRLFVAVDLPEEVRAGLAALQNDLRGVPLPVRWVRPEGIHLTLKFLGEVPDGRRDEIIAALEEVAGMNLVSFHLRPAGLGTFPESGRPRVLWIGLTGDVDAAGALRDAVDGTLATIGFPREAREFRPHLTLGRITGPVRGDWRSFLARFSAAALSTFEVRRCVLFQSLLRPEGATYRPLSELALARGG